MARKQNVVRMHHGLNLNIGIVIFVIIIIYVIFNLISYLTSSPVAEYEVGQGTIATNHVYHGLILRDETVVYAGQSGYINYYLKNGAKASVNDVVYSIDTSGELSRQISDAASTGDMPQVENSRLNVESAQLGEKIAAGDGLPSLTASASIGTGNISGTNYSFYNQLNNKLNENVGITLSVPIFNNRKAKSSIARSRLQTRQAELDYQSMEKDLLKDVESLYQDAVSAQSRYLAANDKVKSAETSYGLVLAQFNEGMKNTVELLTEKNNYLSAQQEQIQAKYQAVLSIKLLNFYQNEPITL